MIDFNVTKHGDRSNKPLVFLHGFMGSSDDWSDIIKRLSNEYYCLAFDLPGHGKTTTNTTSDFKIEQCASELVDWLEKNLKKHYSLCGYSMGGRLALYISINHSDKVEKVIIESASPGLKTEDERKNRILIDQLRAKRLLMEPLNQFLDDWYEMSIFGNLNKESDDYKNMIDRRLNNDPELLAKSLMHMGTGNQPSLWEKLEKIKSHLLLIVGEKDNKFKEIAGEINKLSQNSQIRIIPDAGHTVHLDNKDLYIDEIKSFLKE